MKEADIPVFLWGVAVGLYYTIADNETQSTFDKGLTYVLFIYSFFSLWAKKYTLM